MFYYWTQGLFTVLEPYNLLIIVIGSSLGIMAGAIPGISGTMALALAVPITYVMEPTTALLLLVAIYASSVYAGSISGILFRTPGAPEGVAATLDGHAMAKKGLAGEALGVDIFSSVTGGLFGTLMLALIAPQLAKVALQFGPSEYFALAVLGLSVVSSVGTRNELKALIAVLIGLFVATVGIDKISGFNRFTFGTTTLLSGISFIPAIIGLFAVAEVLNRIREMREMAGIRAKARAKLPSLKLINRLKGLLLRSASIGTFIGILPGVGATTGAFVGLSEAIRWSKHPEKFGTGIPEGVAAPEAANNAAAGGAMVPLLTLGIPGSAGTAIMLGAFLIHGLQPGPLLFVQQPKLVYSIFVGMFLANLSIIIFAKLFIRYFSKVIELPYNILGPGIIIFCVVGTFALRNNFGDVWIMMIFAIIGFFMERHDYPLAPIILGIVLGPIAEENLRQAMIISDNNPLALVSSPLSAILIGLSILSLFSPQLRRLWARRRNAKGRS
ncbi:MAG: C4-dicarboxylate ABC transporter permease [Deltaproteobacteria bacterium]|nr:MAG: C4-dicarboxylate ABC transporter permease [Deltaproteobacteria bacterium]